MRTVAQAFMALSLQLPVEDKSVRDRLSRASDMLVKGGYEFVRHDSGDYTVCKASTTLLEDTGVTYKISRRDKTCTCPDFPSARAGMCKHRLAIMLLEDIKQHDWQSYMAMTREE